MLGVDDDVCQVCGELNPVRHPWYIWPIACAIFLIAFYLLVDLDALIEYFTYRRSPEPGMGHLPFPAE